MVLTGLLDAVFLCRPVVLVPVWGFMLLGAMRWRVVSLQKDPFPLLSSVGAAVWIRVALFSIPVAFVYILNQVADIEADRANPGFSLLGDGCVGIATARAALLVTLFLSVLPPILMDDSVLLYLNVGTLVLGLCYSLEPLRFSGRVLLDCVSNAAGYGVLAFAAGWYAAGGEMVYGLLLQAAAPYVLLMCAGSISSTIPDIEGDRANGKRTTAVALGPVRSHALATLLLVAGVIAALIVRDGVAAAAGGGALVFYLIHLLAQTQRSLEGTYKGGGAVVMIVAALMVPLFAPVALLTALLTRAYFRFRFGVRYPSLLPATGMYD